MNNLNLSTKNIPQNLLNQYDELFEPLFNLPLKLPVTAWYGHIPFLFVLFKNFKPQNYVELGVHNGASLIAASEAAKQYHLPCQLFGIDTWKGDDHTNQYDGDKIYTELDDFLKGQNYQTTLMRGFFSEALPKFENGSIDLLHIDGFHTYEAVKDDYQSWLPKMSPNGIIIFHDTCVKSKDFGVYKLWEEIANQDNSINFPHSHGLGVLFLNPDSEKLNSLKLLISFCNNSDFYYKLAFQIGETINSRMALKDNLNANKFKMTAQLLNDIDSKSLRHLPFSIKQSLAILKYAIKRLFKS